MIRHMCGGHRIICGNQCSPFAMRTARENLTHVLSSAVNALMYKSHFIDLISSLPKSYCAYKAFMKMLIIVILLVQSVDVGKAVIFILNSW